MGKIKIETMPRVAIIIPCFNEEAAISTVINHFRQTIPLAEIHVFDNNSTDATAYIAATQGAIVHYIKKQGKGNVVKAMFRDVDADYYVMVDGDGTYPANITPEFIELMLKTRSDMLVGNRLESYTNSASRVGHLTGNKIITNTVNFLFDSNINDLLSGYRILSRRFVKSIPLFSEGFEVETALSIHAIEIDAKVIEAPISYSERIAGTKSKLNTFRDGFKILLTIITLFKDHRPQLIFSWIGILLGTLGLGIGIPVVAEFLSTGLVPRFPSAILATGLMILSFLNFFTGIIMDSISKNRKIIKKLAFLSIG